MRPSEKTVSGKIAGQISDLRLHLDLIATYLVHEDRSIQMRLWDLLLAFVRKVSELHLSEEDERRMMQYQAQKMLEALDE